MSTYVSHTCTPYLPIGLNWISPLKLYCRNTGVSLSLEINFKMPTYPFLICRFGFFRVYYFCTNIGQNILCTHATIRICPKLCIKSYHSSETIEGPDHMLLRRFHIWDKSILCWASSQPQIQYRQVRFTFFYSRQHSNYFNIFHLSLKTAKLAIQQWNTKCH